MEIENFKIWKEEKKVLPYQITEIEGTSETRTTTIIKDNGKVKLPKKEDPIWVKKKR